MNRRPLLIFALCAALVIVIAGCGSGSDSSSTQATSEAKSQAGEPENLNKRPKVKVPTGPPPKKLEVKELTEGNGPEAKAGDKVTVQYVGVGYKSGTQFDSSWDRGEPFTFKLGVGEVIPGWDQGLEGMKVGSRRELIVPPKLAYGAAGYPPVVAPNATLVFVIDLLAAK